MTGVVSEQQVEPGRSGEGVNHGRHGSKDGATLLERTARKFSFGSGTDSS